MDMTISQALRRISKLKGVVKEQLERAALAVSYTKGEEPAFAFKACMEQADAARFELIKLETALRITNAQTKVHNEGKTITLAEATCLLAERKSRIAWLRSLTGIQPQAERVVEALGWDEIAQRRMKIEKIMKCDLPAAEQARLIEQEQALFDQLNDLVETVNHKTQLL